uniref:Peptidoglycan recognition protein LC isoform A n=1 Tax=Armigeres subalbatus TaxID=124917 RepID=H2BNX4_ARMSU|nr:peptidoglycan recognition protein LC isoform A [Armigeres subalbatus]
MAKARNQQNTPSTIASDAAPSSSTTSAQTRSDNYACSSNSGEAQPSQSTPIDKADTTSSHNISISSITEDENNDSSAFETSDSECDDEQIKKAIERIPNSLQPGSQLVQNGMLVVKEDNSNSPETTRGPNIGSIAVQNSSDITFGNKTYIKGQVVIKNIYHDKQNGATNKGYHETDGELGNPKKDINTSNEPNKQKSWQSSLKVIIRDKPMLSVIFLIAVMVIIVTIVIVAFVATSDDDFLPDAKPLRMVTRNEWLAQPPKETLDKLNLPVNRVIIAHTATENCYTQAQCTFMTQNIQQFHMANDSKNYSDVGYNFLIGGDGNAYVGRDWDKQGAHTKGFNVDSIGIAFIGTFTDVEPPVAQLSAAQQLIAIGLEENKLSKTYRLYGHRQLAPFESPGRMLFKIIQKWPHWSSDLGPNHWQE